MIALPTDYLHLETFAIFLFLSMMFRMQLARADRPDYDVLGALVPLRWAPYLFLFLAIAFVKALLNVSPILGIELAAGITLSLLHPVNALCFMAHLMLLRPWEILIGDPLLSVFPRLLVGLCIFSYLIHPKRKPTVNKRNVRPVQFLVLFSGWLLLTLIKIPGKAAALFKWFDLYLKALTAFGMSIFFIEDDLSVREVELTLALSALSLMINGCYQFLSGEAIGGRMRLVFGKPYNLMGDPNDLGAIIVMAVPFVLVPVFKRASGPFTRLFGLAYAGFAAATVWLTRSRGTMLAAVGQFFVYRIVHTPKKRRLGLVVTALVLGVGYQALTHIVPRDAEEMEASGGSRITYWQTAVNMAVHSPFLGVGFGQYPENYMGYAVGTIYERGNRTAHSSWFLAMGESGFVGFFFYVAFFLSVVKMAWRARERRPAQLYAVAGYGVAMSFLSHTYAMDFYLLMGLVIASGGIAEAKPAPASIPGRTAEAARGS